MSSLSMTEEKLPPGFRFHPRDEELISDYLAMKVSGDPGSGFSTMMIDVDLNSCEPWDLPATARVGEKEWYFYSRRDRKYTTGRRTNRATASGYWKATGIDRPVVDPRRGGLVGMRKTLVFYHGRAPTGKKTDWVLHEFRTDGPAGTPEFSSKDWVLCRVFHKGGGSPTRHNTENCDDHTGPSSLTSLLDGFISFEQSQLSHEGQQQVPCFSGHSPSRQPRRWSSPATLHVSTAQGNVPATVESLACPGDMMGLGAYLQPLSYEKKAIGAVPGHLSMLDGNLNTEGRSSIYLGETWVPHMGNHPF